MTKCSSSTISKSQAAESHRIELHQHPPLAYRGNAKCVIFKKAADFHAFERIFAEGMERYPCQILAYQLLSNHWHFVLRPTEDRGMSNFLRWVTLTDQEIDAVRWSLKRGSPFGDETWVESTARRLDLESTLRPRGRPQVRDLPNKDVADTVVCSQRLGFREAGYVVFELLFSLMDEI